MNKSKIKNQKSKIRKTARKRFKVTKRGKLVAEQSHFSHLRSKRTSGEKHRKRKRLVYGSGRIAKRIRQLVSS